MAVPKTRILIVEDDSSDLELLMRQIQKAGLDAQVKAVENGTNALAFLLSNSEDLVAMFLDLHLPGLSGLEILEKVRTYHSLKALPVVVMTSSNHPDDLEKCRRLGVASYVQKPVTFASFSKAIADTFHPSRPPSPKPRNR
jgi:CheY-like chemotaxis protein